MTIAAAVVLVVIALEGARRWHLRRVSEVAGEVFLFGFGAGARAVWETVHEAELDQDVEFEVDPEHLAAQLRNAMEGLQ